ncbi:MAG: hypothetical protein Q8N44_05940 [Rubrivivax sp.]|nr:hypothetical protein [Rubrivivax sp.]
MLPQHRIVPIPGPVWGSCPQRPAAQALAPQRRGGAWRQIANASLRHRQDWQALAAPQRMAALQQLRGRLRRDGLQADVLAQALGAVSVCAAETLGCTPRAGQLLAAAALLDNRMAEMATGEGKTLAVALAAAVAALAGIPVHVVTANDYLAGRDASALAPLFGALGLRAAALAGAGDAADRRAVYAHDIVYATAKELAFDFLRDRQAAAGAPELLQVAAALGGQPVPAPLLRGRCMVLLDEADSILLDEAEVPLILSRSVPQAARRALLWQALALARQLSAGRDFELHAADRLVTLNKAGEARLATLAAGLGGPWQRPRYRREALVVALAGLHAYRRNAHYVVRDGAIEVLDEVTGRVAPGRVWSRGLHTVLALKEGLSPPPETETVARITFQRFFQGYWRLAGCSGTLWEARAELRQVYGTPVVRIPLHQRCRRIEWAPQRFATPAALFEAAAERAAALSRSGRPVLVGTDSVDDSLQLSTCLRRSGIEHRVLSALNDGDEAAIVAAAGQAGRITIATRMAGRGTDIVLDATARAAGGLHVLSCQHNASRRLDRQLVGRAARHGDPGSTEAWCSAAFLGHRAAPAVDTLPGWTPNTRSRTVSWLSRVIARGRQWRDERRRALLRRSLLEQDLHWEQRLAFAGAPL